MSSEEENGQWLYGLCLEQFSLSDPDKNLIEFREPACAINNVTFLVHQISTYLIGYENTQTKNMLRI